ncbi:hypothetical protein B0H14DRAFT_1263659 [Mycena olivaceomarginata]|nr:hypothetical protein B0H14DRAFT_1263659 [Mycena olivaceomarginata]
MLRGFNKLEFFCMVDLFRLPDTPNVSNRLSFYARDGTCDQNGHPTFALLFTDYPPRETEFRIGNHLLLDDSKETHLLQRQTPVMGAVEIPDGLVFPFPCLGVLQKGQYILRYTLYNKTQNGPPLAKCFGQPFTVYSVNSYPGVFPPTQLSQLLARLKVPGFGSKYST